MSFSGKIAKIRFGLRSSMGRRALRYGVGAAIEHARILSDFPWKTIVDIGANRGQFALAALNLQPAAEVHSFEPLEEPGGTFTKIFADTPGVRLHPCAIGPSCSAATINVSARDDSSSLLPISEMQTRLFPGTEAITTTTIMVRTLESVLQADMIAAPALLKLDVQGYEYPALLGCETLLPLFDGIYVESSLIELYKGQHLVSDIVVWLKERGFWMSDIGDLTRDLNGRAVQGDFFFESSR